MDETSSYIPVKQTYPEKRNRLTVFFRYFMCIPHFIVGFFYGLIALVCVIIAWFSIVFTGKYPEGLYKQVVGTLHWGNRVMTYFFLRHDTFPPFDREPHPEFPAAMVLPERQESYDRVKTLFRIILMIPVYVIAYIFGLWSLVMAVATWFVAVFTGKTSEGLMEAGRMPSVYTSRAYAYYLLVTEAWPPFEPGPNSLGDSGISFSKA